MDHGIDIGALGMGPVRSLQDYERFAGLNFKERLIHAGTLAQEIPPVAWEGRLIRVVR